MDDKGETRDRFFGMAGESDGRGQVADIIRVSRIRGRLTFPTAVELRSAFGRLLPQGRKNLDGVKPASACDSHPSITTFGAARTETSYLSYVES